MLTYGVYQWVLVDRDPSGLLDALSQAKQVTKGHKLQLLVIGVAIFGIKHFLKSCFLCFALCFVYLFFFVVGFVSSVVFSLLFSCVPGLSRTSTAGPDRTFWAVIRSDEEDFSEAAPSENP